MRGIAFTLRLSAALLVPWVVACGGHEARTLRMRTALDAGNAKAALRALDDELGVKTSAELPKDIKGDNAILVLDRASVQQGASDFSLSKRDFEAADKAVDMLDLARNAGDSLGEYVFSGSSGRYQAPPYEKLMINTLNMVNYLETKDLNGARIEARRLAVMQKYYRDTMKHADNPVLGLGSLLAGFTFEKSGDADEALRYYDEALGFTGFGTLAESVRRLASRAQYRSPRITALLAQASSSEHDGGDALGAQGAKEETGEVLFVVGYGRVAHKMANRIPIGLALTYFASSLNPGDAVAAHKLAAQGLVTWVNYPSLAPGRGTWELPSLRVDRNSVVLEEAVDVDREVRSEWEKIEGKVVVSAITRLVARAAVGQGIQVAAGRDSVLGFIASLGAQITLTSLDTPDTRSWETLPARMAVARVRLPVGRHQVAIDARGWQRAQAIDVEKGGWHVISLMALR